MSESGYRTEVENISSSKHHSSNMTKRKKENEAAKPTEVDQLKNVMQLVLVFNFSQTRLFMPLQTCSRVTKLDN